MDARTAFEFYSRKKVFDYEKAANSSYRASAEGIVLLKNDNGALPLKSDERIAFFGRMQKHYLASGTGSGGRVSPRYTANIFDSLSVYNVHPDKELELFYDAFVAENPYDSGDGWANPASQKEPDLSEKFISEAASRNDTALFVITRIAGEACDLTPGRGGYMLTETELKTLSQIRSSFEKVVVILNISGVIDLSELTEANPDAILLVWHGGMNGGKSCADVLLGTVNPSGRLPDTFPKSLDSYPNPYPQSEETVYTEDVYVGYRFFETKRVCPDDRVIYPFGYGLSYTDFVIDNLSFIKKDGIITVKYSVTNTGRRHGKEVVQCYVKRPEGRHGNPEKILAAFDKTPLLAPGECYEGSLDFPESALASYDDYECEYYLAGGEYTVLLGKNIRDTKEVFSFVTEKDTVIKKCESALSPQKPFDRPFDISPSSKAPTHKSDINNNMPSAIKRVPKDGMTFDDVASGKASISEFVARFSDEDLCNIVRGEGMSSPKVTPGTGAAFVGVTPSLVAMGLPTLCCTDGPSGIRMVSDAKCVMYPSATCLASTWNPKIVEEAYEHCGRELAYYGVDLLLGPGINIHRTPLCGRNFEYFSEDPLLAGKISSAVCRGLGRAGVSGVIKHFLANNQELNRHTNNSVLSERAVREIYAKPFEICVKESDVRAVMTSYNRINGIWAATNRDLMTKLLRNEFGFTGIIMTDWWANLTDKNGNESKTALSEMVRAGGDVYMVMPDALTHEDDLAEEIKKSPETVACLLQCACNLCRYALESLSYAAKKSGIGARDLRHECEDKTRTDIANENGVFAITSDSAKRVIIKIGFVSSTPALTQSSVSMNVNTKSAAFFMICGTNGAVTEEYREISLVSGKNEIVFTSETPLCNAVSVTLYE